MGIRSRVRQSRFTSAASEAWVSVVVAGDYLTQLAEDVFRRHGITGDQYNVLRILRGARPDGLARGEITRRVLRRSPDTTRMIDRLERANLVERGSGAADGRLSVARITKRGLSLLERVDPDLEEVMASATAPLTETQLRQLSRLCDGLVP